MARRDPADGAALDPALTQKKRARRRLLGALVLGIAAAIVLPLVLDSEPRQTITDVQIEIPPRDAPMPSRASEEAAAPSAAVPSDEIAAAPQEPLASDPRMRDGAARSATEAAHAVPVPRDPAPHDATASEPKSADSRSVASRAADSKSADSKSADSKTAESAKPAASGAKRATTPATRPPTVATAKPATVTPAPRESATGSAFALQVGAFANPGSARAQVDKIRKAGLRPYTEKVQTAQGARTRVRVGPFETREAAERARASLKLAGIDSAVVGQ